jgi:hypothetical protein
MTAPFAIGDPVEFVEDGRKTVVLAVCHDQRIVVAGSPARFPPSAFRRAREGGNPPED